MARAGTKGRSGPKAPTPTGDRAPVFDVAGLLKPISRKLPGGESLRYEGTYDAVRAARTEDDESLPRGIWETERKRADWRQVEMLCLDAIGKRSKDLQLAIWLTEAAFMRHGLPGLSDGLAVVNGLIEGYWDGLHPEMPEDDPEYRAAPIQWMSDHMAVRLRLMPLNLARGDELPAFCLADWQRAKLARTEDEDDGDAASGEGAPVYRDRAEMQAAAKGDPPEHYRDLVLAIDEIGERLDDLDALIDRHFKPVDAPGLHAMRDVLAEIRRFSMRILEQRNAVGLLNGDGESKPAVSSTPPDETKQDGARGGKTVAKKAKPAAAGVAGAAGGPIRNRNEAYERLEEAAAWLMENEPHSPTPYLIQRAVSWRDKSLVELLSELVPDDGYRGFLQSLFGAGGGRPQAERYDDDDDEWKDSDDEH